VAAVLRIRNSSAIPMRLEIRRAPEWLLLPGLIRLDARTVTALRPTITAAAPAGTHRIELEAEVLNLHVAPERNLRATVPLTVQIER
jgi:hypothetical protein